MKRDHHETTSYATTNSSSSNISDCKSKLWDEYSGIDELLVVLGYKVCSSDIVEVAYKLEQLEMVLGRAQEDGLSHLSETDHYNPSDLSGWVQSMLSELRGNDSSLVLSRIKDSEYDLRAIPSVAALLNNESDSNKWIKTAEDSRSLSNNFVIFSPTSVGSRSGELTRPVVLMDSQESGVRLVHMLMACAEAVQQEKYKLVDALVKHVGILAASQAKAMRKVATYFTEALARRIYKIYPPQECLDSSYTDILQLHFYKTCLYLKLS